MGRGKGRMVLFRRGRGGVLTEAKDYQAARNYWKVTKKRLKDEGNQSVTNCNRLKLKAADGKRRHRGTRRGRRTARGMTV